MRKNLFNAKLRYRSRIATACRLALCGTALTTGIATAPAWSQVAGDGSDVSITVSMNQWLGTAGSSWSDVANWQWGALFNLPSANMPVHIGPVQQLVNGFPVGFDLPASEAVLDSSFGTPGLTVVAWDGLSQLRLVSGGLLDTNAVIGGTHSAYTPTGAILPATLVLDGGNTAGYWSFTDHSRVVVNGQYGMPGGSWYGTLDNLTVTAGSTFTAPSGLAVKSLNNAGALQLSSGSHWTIAGSLHNAGTLTVQGGYSTGSASISLAADTTLAGTGNTVLSDANYSYIYGGGHTLTIGAGHTLRGAGYIGADGNINVVNQGSLLAEGDGQVLSLHLGAGNSFNNSAGTVTVSDGATLNLYSGTFTGGTVTGQGSAKLTGSGTFANTRLAGQLNVGVGTTLNTAGTITNDGKLTVQGSYSTGSASISLAADTTLAGTGNTVLSDANYSYIYGGGHTLTIGAGHTLRGAGYIGADGNINVVNQGSLLAEGDGQVLSLHLGGGNSFNNSAGTVTVADGATLNLYSGTFTGGTVTGQDSAKLAGSGTFANMSFVGALQTAGSSLTIQGSSLAGQLTVGSGATLNTAGTITNDGKLTVQGSYSTGSASISLAADTTLAGAGNTVLSDANYSYIYGGGHTLTIGARHTLRGAGYIGADGNINVVNQGSLLAEGDGQVLSLHLGSGNSFNNSAGTVNVADGATINLYSGIFTGGTITGQGSARLMGGGTYANTRLAGQLNVGVGTTLYTAGTITNDGKLTVQGSYSTGSASISLAADTTLAGTGNTVLSDANYSYIYGGGRTLTIGAGHTLRGAGYIGADGNINVVNQGSLLAGGDGQALTLYLGTGNTFDNSAGTLVVMSDSELQLLSGTVLLGDASTLRFDVDTAVGGASEVGMFTLAGDVSFDGTLALDLSNYNAQVGDSFTLLSFSGSGNGQFDQVLAAGYNVAVHYNQHDVTVEITGVSAVPEPSQWVLMAAGLLALRWGAGRNPARHLHARSSAWRRALQAD